MRNNAVIFALCLCLGLALVACGGPTATPLPETAIVQEPATPLPETAIVQEPATPLFALTACADYERIGVGEYSLNNNVWNKGDRTDYTQCVFAQGDTPPTAMGWRWDWPGSRRTIQAYPEVMVGDSPWDAEPPTMGFPLPVSVRDLLVTYTASISATGNWNVALELWLTSDSAPAEENITDEVMIWVDANGLVPGPLLYDRVTLDGVAYKVYVAPGHGDASGGSAATWNYIAFMTEDPLLSATLNISLFLDYLVEKQVIAPDRYIASLELGTEIASGKGEFILSTYEVTASAAEIDAAATPEAQAPADDRITNLPSLPASYYEASYGKLKYGLYVPENYDPAQSYPLIIHLHGYSYLNSD
ncbi:MAG: hypothetical protein JXA21_24910, partial [Anaerolineae bacterium]|nr:hypothetical protein [Anaerolineae bacterium]